MNAVFTIVAKNFYARAVALGDSVTRYHPHVYFHILLADEISPEFEAVEKRYPTIEVSKMGIPFWERMAFQYTITEFCTAVKPFFMEYLFKEYGYEAVLYLDPDTYLYDNFNEVFAILHEDFLVLTPHITDIRKAAECFIPDRTFLFSGVYNLGFIGFSNRPETFELLGWWKDRLINQCYHDTIESLFVDQKWLNFVTCFFDTGVHVLRDPGYNVAFWNMHERAISKDQAGYVVNGQYRLRMMHFSNIGIAPRDFSVVTKQQRSNTDGDRHYLELIEAYCECVIEAGDPVFSKMPYKFARFSNNKLIYDFQRRLFRITATQGRDDSYPFSSEGPFYSLLDRNGLICDEKTVPNVISRQSYSQPDAQIRKLFRYLRWFVKVFGIRNYLKFKKATWFLQRDENQLWLIGDIDH